MWGCQCPLVLSSKNSLPRADLYSVSASSTSQPNLIWKAVSSGDHRAVPSDPCWLISQPIPAPYSTVEINQINRRPIKLIASQSRLNEPVQKSASHPPPFEHKRFKLGKNKRLTITWRGLLAACKNYVQDQLLNTSPSFQIVRYNSYRWNTPYQAMFAYLVFLTVFHFTFFTKWFHF